MFDLSCVVFSFLHVVYSAENDGDSHRDSVVKIYTSQSTPDPFRPWTNNDSQGMRHMGTGFVIEGNRILTNAHVAGHATEILIESEQLPRKLSATLEHIAYDVDVAVLRVETPEFFEMHPPVQFQTELPKEQDQVKALGYPIGGDVMSTTVGVVSRIEHGRYWNGHDDLQVQVDAALNGGNSGGPIFSGESCVGMSMGGYNNQDANSIGYLIPSLVIQRTLDDFADGHYHGDPELGAKLIGTENPALRKSLGLSLMDSGMTVVSADPESGLQPWDVITQIGPSSIDDTGYGQAYGLRLSYPALISAFANADATVEVQVIRDGESQPLTVNLTKDADELMLFPKNASYEFEYFVVGPFVLVAATEQHANLAYDDAWGRSLVFTSSPLATRRMDRKAFEDEQIVVLSTSPFSHPVLRGYDKLQSCMAIQSINGEPVKNIQHARALILACKDEWIDLEFSNSPSEVLRLDLKQLFDSTQEVLEKNSIRNPSSPGLEMPFYQD